MNIRVIEQMHDPYLKAEWERLEKESDVFPQSTYHWCATWWKYLSGRRKLHVVVAMDEKGKALSIAPLCIDRHFGIRVLRSFPVHFGDFYTFIGDDTESTEATDRILDYILSHDRWLWARLEQVAETNPLGMSLANRGFRKKRMTACVIVNFGKMRWDEYLALLKKTFRAEVRRRIRNIEKEYTPSLRVISDESEFACRFDEMVRIHEHRWKDDNAPAKAEIERACWKEAIEGQFHVKNMKYYELCFDGVPAAYRLGFMHGSMFYAWHTSFNTDYSRHYPGIMMLAFMIKHFMQRGTVGINFMAGEYDWKLDWSADRKTVANCMYSSPSTNLATALLNWYHHRLRDRLKAIYHRLMENQTLRAVSRKVFYIRQKLADQR